jgi:signal transduction histidine kinase
MAEERGSGEQRAEQRLRVLADTMRAFAEATSDLPALLDTIVRRMTDSIADFCAVRLLEDEGQMLGMAVGYDRDPEALANLQQLFDSVPRRVQDVPLFQHAASGRPLLVPSLDADKLRAAIGPELAAKALRSGISSLLVMPLRAHGRVIGILTLARRGAGRAPLDQADLALAQDLADHAAVAITNGRLYADAQQALAERARVQEALQRSEEQLRHAQKMEALGRLAGGIAHDFNNLLTVILSCGDSLLADPGAPEAREDVEEIRHAAQRATELTRQLLAFGRQQVLQPSVTSLNDVVAEAEKLLRRLLGEDVQLVARGASGLWPVLVDPGQMQQVIVNLAVNARDAMPGGGKLTIETGNVTLDETYASQHVGVTPGPHVMLAVSDTGSGMDRETQARIFDPFFTTKERGKGTGLGLSTVFGIVKQSGGHIWVYSEPGRGSAFKVYFPRVEREDAAVAAAAAAAAAAGAGATPDEPPAGSLRGSETILLVEDDEQVRAVARRALDRYGYCVLEATGVHAALELCASYEGPIHLLLTDVVMPGMSGRKVAARVVASRPSTQVLYMSGYTEDAIVHHGVLDPGIAFVAKPFTPEGLARKVRAVLDG